MTDPCDLRRLADAQPPVDQDPLGDHRLDGRYNDCAAESNRAASAKPPAMLRSRYQPPTT
jgi:hypothetical protein